MYDGGDDLLTEVQTAALIGYSPRTLAAWRQRGQGPRFIRVSTRSVRYRRADLVAWIERNTRTSTRDREAAK